MHIEWNLRNGCKGQAAVQSGSDKKNRVINQGLQQGNVLIDGVSTKHYLKEELTLILEKRGLIIKQILKINYPWDIEFSEPPNWMKEPSRNSFVAQFVVWYSAGAVVFVVVLLPAIALTRAVNMADVENLRQMTAALGPIKRLVGPALTLIEKLLIATGRFGRTSSGSVAKEELPL